MQSENVCTAHGMAILIARVFNLQVASAMGALLSVLGVNEGLDFHSAAPNCCKVASVEMKIWVDGFTHTFWDCV